MGRNSSLNFGIQGYAFILLLASMLLGGMIIRFFGIQIAHVEVAGGLILFHSAWRMLNGNRESRATESGTTQKNFAEMTFFPLTLPITAGPGCIAASIAVGGRIAHKSLEEILTSYAGAALGILGVALSIWLCFHFAQRVFSKLGPTGTMVVTKLSAFVLLAIGVEIFWSGLSLLIGTLR